LAGSGGGRGDLTAPPLSTLDVLVGTGGGGVLPTRAAAAEEPVTATTTPRLAQPGRWVAAGCWCGADDGRPTRSSLVPATVLAGGTFSLTPATPTSPRLKLSTALWTLTFSSLLFPNDFSGSCDTPPVASGGNSTLFDVCSRSRDSSTFRGEASATTRDDRGTLEELSSSSLLWSLMTPFVVAISAGS